MKILYISNGSNFQSAGGMEYHLLDITAWLGTKNVETAFAVRKGTVLERDLLRNRPSVYRLDWTGLNKVRSNSGFAPPTIWLTSRPVIGPRLKPIMAWPVARTRFEARAVRPR